MYIYLTILSGQVAIDAKINPGIISGVLSTSILFTSVFSYVLFNERITLKMMLGITIVIISVTWILMVNGNASGQNFCEISCDAEASQKVLAILLALAASFMTSIRAVQAKWVYVKHGYGPFDFSIDSGFLTGFTLLAFWVYFYLSVEHQSMYTPENAVYSLFGSLLAVLWGLAGLYSVVHGLQGPAMAIQ